jgi:hypothetical protein
VWENTKSDEHAKLAKADVLCTFEEDVGDRGRSLFSFYYIPSMSLRCDEKKVVKFNKKRISILCICALPFSYNLKAMVF